ncbi:MAG: hypothetical protein JSR13_02700 [Proteobacteria bacterium]|nr:hypothetical protein [Pseudomonadota bacterium]
MSERNRRRAAADIEKILAVLNRDTAIDALTSLVYAVKGGAHSATLASSAIMIDANAILRIPSHPKSADIIDYLTGVHSGPVMLPGQVIQEFWNNQASVATTIFHKIQNKHNDLVREIDKAKDTGLSASEPISLAVAAFREENEHIFDAELITKTSQFLERLAEKAIVPYAPRSGLDAIAIHRKRTKTPPGFRDDGDGDFLVWVDALFGLLRERRYGGVFSQVILLSNDKKIDWCRGNTAHPILHAEMKAILGVHFEVWTLDYFAKQITEAM